MTDDPSNEGSMMMMPARMAPLGRTDRRAATILFCDIVNSTQFVAPIDPEDARDVLSGVLNTMIRHVTRYGGTLCQTLGDGIYAIFGAPAAQENHAVRACFAADAIIREVTRSGVFAVRIGLCSGEVLWDGEALRTHAGPPATGRPVHSAAKLQQSAPPNAIRLSGSTASLAGDWLELKACQPLRLTDDDHIPNFELLGVRRRRLQTTEQLPMVGRDRLRLMLEAALDALSAGDNTRELGMRLISAEAGMGKSRMLSRLVAEARRRSLWVIEWAVPAVMPVGAPSLLHDLTASLLDAPVPATFEGTVALARAGGAGAAGAEALAGLLHPTCTGRPDMSPAENRLVLAAGALVDLMREGSRRRPLVLVMEDLHWAGSEVLAVLAALLPRLAGHRLLVLASSRLDRLPGNLDDGADIRIHRLAPLSPEDGRALLDGQMGPAPALETVKQDLLRRAQGNPFFLVECVRVLLDQGVVSGPIGAMERCAPLEQRRLPDTVQALLAARTDALADPLRDILRAAAVIGPTFDIALLAALTGTAPQNLPLAALAAAGMIDETRLLPRLEFSFHHALMHEAVYDGMTRRDRQNLHARLVSLLDEPTFASLGGRLAAQAFHAAQARLWPIAVAAGREAGCAALKQSLAAEAASLFALALDASHHLPPDSQSTSDSIDLRLMLARAAMPAGQRERAVTELSAAVTLAQEVGDLSRALVAMVQQVSYERVYGNLHQAVALSQSALQLSHASEEGIDCHPELLIVAASCLIEQGRAEEALDLLRRLDHPSVWQGHQEGRFLMMDWRMLREMQLACCYSLLRRDEEAEPLLQQALRRADATSYAFNRIHARAYAAEIRVRQGKFPDVLVLCNEALAISRTTGSTLLDALHHARHGLALVKLGRAEEGMAEIVRAEQLATGRAATLHLAWTWFCRTLALRHMGRRDDAADQRRRLEHLIDERGYGQLRIMLAAVARSEPLSV